MVNGDDVEQGGCVHQPGGRVPDELRGRPRLAVALHQKPEAQQRDDAVEALPAECADAGDGGVTCARVERLRRVHGEKEGETDEEGGHGLTPWQDGRILAPHGRTTGIFDPSPCSAVEPGLGRR